MLKNSGHWILSTLGVASVVISFVLLFSTTVKAYCTVSVQCPDGPLITCSGDTCQGTSNCVTCRFNDRPAPENKCCGGDN
jgi:hypothetical protein